MDGVSLQDIQTLARQESAKMHHFFIGVEHLFVALTQVTGGLTVAVLEQYGLSPRFVRYSVRESIGRYEDRRYWPGFPETPRAAQVLKLAAAHAGDNPPAERELLLAILDEGDSVVIRVLDEIGADVAALRETAAAWSEPLTPRRPEVPVQGDVALSEEDLRVLKIMFRDAARVDVLRELRGGYSGARVLLVRSLRVDGRQDAPVVVKLDHRYDVLYERRRYDLHVKDTLPLATARLLDSPIVPDNSTVGGLKYTFVGRIHDTGPLSLREFASERDPQELSTLLRSLFDLFGPSWWLQRNPYHFGVWREYEHVLPPALVVDALPDKDAVVAGHALSPLGAWSRTNHVMAGEVVALNGFVVQKIDETRDVLYLAAGALPEAVNRTGKVEVRGLGVGNGNFFRGEVVDQIVGRVVSTRDDLLLRTLSGLGPNFDLRLDRLPSGHEGVPDLPNPLNRVTWLLEQQIDGYMSTIHGDLHLGNILVGPQGNPWLIDFAWAREAHTLFDWAMLEISLLVEVVSRLAPPGWEGAWGTVALLRSMNAGENTIHRERHQVARMLTVVKTVREIVSECLVYPERMNEYYVALAVLALRLMDWKSETVDGRRLAFLVSALSLSELRDTKDGQTSVSRTEKTDLTTALDQGGHPFDE